MLDMRTTDGNFNTSCGHSALTSANISHIFSVTVTYQK